MANHKLEYSQAHSSRLSSDEGQVISAYVCEFCGALADNAADLALLRAAECEVRTRVESGG